MGRVDLNTFVGPSGPRPKSVRVHVASSIGPFNKLDETQKKIRLRPDLLYRRSVITIMVFDDD